MPPELQLVHFAIWTPSFIIERNADIQSDWRVDVMYGASQHQDESVGTRDLTSGLCESCYGFSMFPIPGNASESGYACEDKTWTCTIPSHTTAVCKRARPGRLSRVMVCWGKAKNENYRAHVLGYVSGTQLVSLDTAHYYRASSFPSVFLSLFNHLVFLYCNLWRTGRMNVA